MYLQNFVLKKIDSYSTRQSINLSELLPGIYFIKGTNSSTNKIEILKFEKQ
jgi:hypothetical protein